MIPVLAIPVLNKYELLDKALESIDFPIKEILIINNGEQKYRPKRHDLNIRVLNLPFNLGLAASWNLTIKLYPNEKFWFFSSADIVFAKGALELAYSHSSESAINCSEEGWSCFSIGEDFIRKIGLFDENYYPYQCEDDDYYQRYLIAKEIHTDLSFYNKNFPVYSPDGISQTIANNLELKEQAYKRREKNKEYYESKKSQNFQVVGQWSIDRIREQQWEK
jgi:hypothetical protein